MRMLDLARAQSCPECGYQLRRIEPDQCPECGVKIILADLDARPVQARPASPDKSLPDTSA
jgi:DNA-directed RNA polymerase subunit RPC12/RpoP